VPAKHVPAIATQYGLRRRQLRPDLYGPQQKKASSPEIISEEETNISSPE
jgi:hypothetical protein